MLQRFAAVILAIACLAATASPVLSAIPDRSLHDGDLGLIQGRAHIYEGALGTYIEVANRGSTLPVAGFIPFGDEHGYPGLRDIEGQRVEVVGVVDGSGLIALTDPRQLRVLAADRAEY